MASSHVLLDQVDIAFDDQRAVASAELLLLATLAERLGIEQAADQLVDLGDQPGAARPGRYHAFVSNRVGATTWLDADHRRHAVCELAIRDLKAGAGLAHLPSGRFAANAAWLLAATLAHNLLRWTASLGLG